MVMDWQNTNRKNNKFDIKHSNICLVCNLVQEGHIHYVSYSDQVLRKLNRNSWNKVIATIRKLRSTTQVLSAAFYNILEGIMKNTKPISSSFSKTDIGKLANQAWKEQEELGWINVAKGRLCRKWGETMLHSFHLDKNNGGGTDWDVIENVE